MEGRALVGRNLARTQEIGRKSGSQKDRAYGGQLRFKKLKANYRLAAAGRVGDFRIDGKECGGQRFENVFEEPRRTQNFSSEQYAEGGIDKGN